MRNLGESIRQTRTHVHAALGTLLALATALVPTPALSTDPPKSNRLEEILVTGEKTERSLKDTTSSVAVISQEILDTMRHPSFSDAVSEITNVVVLSGSMPDIRGVSGNGPAGGFNSISGGAKGRVAILVDGVAQPFVADLTGDAGIWDVEQIEVYRGPQSTSNGRNSIAGSVHINTKDPSFDWEGAARIGYRNERDYVDTSAVLSGPILRDVLAFRVDAQRLDAQTITDDSEYTTNPAPYDLNEIRADRVRGKLLWSPAEDFDALVSFSSSREEGDTGRIFYEGLDPSGRKRLYFRDIDTKSDTTSLKLSHVVSDRISVDALFALMNYTWGFDSYEPTPAAEQQLEFDEQNRTVDIKANFNFLDSRVNGFIGIAYFDREQDIMSVGSYVYDGDDESDSIGVYGEVDYALTDSLALILGGRLERESQDRNFTFGPIHSVLDQTETILLPKVALRYDLDDRTTLSVSARKGYNGPGGALNYSAGEYYFYDEEKVTAYEGAIRSSLADDRVLLNANIFFNRYDGYQALSSTRFIVNMDRVTTYGAELEGILRPTSSLELTLGLGLLHTDIDDAGPNYPNADGNELNSAPEITVNAGARYWFNESLDFGISVQHVDEYFGDFLNSPEQEAGDYTLTRLSVNYTWQHWRLSAFLNNAFDEEAATTRGARDARYPLGYVSVVQPRHFGISVAYRF
jgi:outer membrane receptor protein involved in Fe transport